MRLSSRRLSSRRLSSRTRNRWGGYRFLAAALASTFLLAATAVATAAGAARFPPRNVCTEDPGHVECFTEHGGLIHGGTVTTPSFTLTCRAFRVVWMQRYDGRGSSSYAESREVVVAGVCEQKSLDGELIRRWGTVGTVPGPNNFSSNYWSSTSAGLPSPVVRLLSHNGGKRKNWSWLGYYFPDGWGWGHASDTGQEASYQHWSPLINNQVWEYDPAGSSAVESPRFDGSVSCTPGHVICSAYLKVKHPHPESEEVEVEMVGAWRWHNRNRKRGFTQHDRRAAWHHQLFEAPAP